MITVHEPEGFEVAIHSLTRHRERTESKQLTGREGRTDMMDDDSTEKKIS